ncbi:MAG: CPBP family intramembrane metalloprotease [Caldilineales bacterium]|nr:CPBP family intramembrane metalloprotease [Caldilineales bacterium]
MIFAAAPALAVGVGWLPPAASQLVALSASLAGVVLVLIEGRKGGLRELLGRALIWRVGAQWWAVALFFMVVPAVATLYLYHWLGGPAVDWSGLQPLYTAIPSFFILTIFAGVGEEFGWRGFLLPRLQTRHNALVSGLIVGVAWATWHIPLFFVKGTMQYELQLQGGALLAILGYSAWIIAHSIQFTWLFNNTRGSVLMAAVLHGATNAWSGYFGMNKLPFDGILTLSAVSVVISIVIVALAGAANLSRSQVRNVLALADGQPDAPRSSAEGVAQAAGSR